MKRYLRILLTALFAALFLGFAVYSYQLSEIQINLVGGSGKDSKPELKYHFMLIAQDMGSTFWRQVRSGAEIAGEEYEAAIEFNGSMIRDEDTALELINIAIASRVDGIVVYVTDDSKFTPLIDKAVSMGIHVVTIESDDKKSKRQVFVGPNSYTAGYYGGNLVAEATDGKANAAIIIGGNYACNKDAKNSLLKGFKDSALTSPAVRYQPFELSDTGYFSAETVIRQIVIDHPEIDTVVCTDLDDTMEVVQVLIDLNKESDLTVIGYGNTSQIREFIKNNNLYGSVYEDPKDTGYQSIERLVQSITGQNPPGSNSTGVYTITRTNLVSYHGS